MSRRRFLKWALLGGGVVAASGAGLLTFTGWPPGAEGLRELGRFRYRTMRLIAEAVLPADGPFSFGADDLGIAKAFDNFLADETPQNQRDLKAALTLMEFGPLVFEGRFSVFSRLSAMERRDFWQRRLESERDLERQAATALTRFINLVFYDNPRAWEEIGYPGPLMYQQTRGKQAGAR